MKLSIFCILLVCAAQSIQAQKSFSDKDLVVASLFGKEKSNRITPLQVKHKDPLSKYNPVTLSFRAAMLFYQGVLSPQISAYCVYQISCSNFSKHLIHDFGLIKGIALSADRLMRCNGNASQETPDILYDNSTEKLIDETYMYRWNYDR